MSDLIFTGHRDEVLGALKSSSATTAIFYASGVMRGVKGAGNAVALNETGYDKNLSFISGSSTGGCIGTFLASGNPLRGANLYSEECCTREFLDPKRRENICDIGFLSEHFKRHVNVEKVFAHPSRLMLMAADAETAEPIYGEPQTGEELHSLLAGGAAMSGVSSDRFYYQGRRIVDAAAVDPLPIDWFMGLPEGERPTYILVIANRPYRPVAPLARMQAMVKNGLNLAIETYYFQVTFRREVSPPLRTLWPTRHFRFMAKAEAAVRRTDVKVACCWVSEQAQVGTFERDPTKLRKAVLRSRNDWLEELAKT